MEYNYVLVTRTGGVGDMLMIEPAIEALYYKFAPCRIILRTHGHYPWVLEGHPLIWKTILDDYPCSVYGMRESDWYTTNLKGQLPQQVHLLHVNMSDVIENLNGLHGVDAFAANANVKLLRKTPSFGRYDFPLNHKTVVQLRRNTDGRGLTRDHLPMHLLRNATFIEDIEGQMTGGQFRDLVAGADIFIGSDSGGLHIAHAAGVNNIVGWYIDRYPAILRAYPGMQTARTIKEFAEKIEIALKKEKYPTARLNEGNAAEWIRHLAHQHCHGYGIDVGCSQWPLAGAEVGISDISQRHKFQLGPFDFVFSSHMLEHVDNMEEELKQWNACLKPGGTLFVYLPHPCMEKWWPGSEWVGDGHKRTINPVLLVRWIQENTDIEVLEYTCHPDPYWSFYLIGRKR